MQQDLRGRHIVDHMLWATEMGLTITILELIFTMIA